MKKSIILIFLLVLVKGLAAQDLYFPPTSGDDWETSDPAGLGWNTDKIDSLYAYLEEINSKGFILLKDGKIVLEQYFGTFTKDSAWYWASAGKTLTGFLVGLAQQEGYFSLDDRSADYLGEGWTSCTKEQEDRITVRHQLSMTTGLDDGVDDHYCTLSSCLIYKADPGTRWAYHNGPYTLLDGVIEATTGKSMNLFMAQEVGAQTGISGLFIQSGYNNVYFSKPRSMARFGLLLLNKGSWGETALLTDTVYFHDMVHSSQDLNKSYGYLTWLNGQESFMVPGLQYVFDGSFNPDAPDDMYAAMGKNGQFLDVVPSKNIVVVRMGNAPDGSEVPFLYNDSIWIWLNKIIVEEDPTGNHGFQPVVTSVQQIDGTGKILVRIEGNAEATASLIDLNGRELDRTSGRGELLLETKATKQVVLVRVQQSGGVAVKKVLLQ